MKTKTKKKLNLAISERFREMQKKSWEARKRNILKSVKAEKKLTN